MNDETSESGRAPADSSLSVGLTDPARPECLTLFQHLWEELGLLYGDTGPCQFAPADVAGPGAAFVVARLGRRPAGCGAIAPLAPGVAEVKRMFVEPFARRRGVARAVLQQLEAAARGLGYTTVRLETGIRQPAAIRLYDAAGYSRIERYGRHVEDPLSVCFEKQLGEEAA